MTEILKYTALVLAGLSPLASAFAQADPAGWPMATDPLSGVSQPASAALPGSVAGWGNYLLANNRVPFADLIPESALLSNEQKNRFLSGLDGPFRLEGTGEGGVLAAFGDSSLSWQAGVAWQSQTFARFENPETAGLILQGNAPYAGRAVEETEVFLRQFSTWKVSAGVAGGKGRFRWGARLTGWVPSSWTEISDLSYRLFTTSQGDSADVTLAYSALTGGNGWGLTTDLGVVWKKGKFQVEAAVLALGAVQVTGPGREVNAQIRFAGVKIANPFEENAFEGLFDGLADSLENEVLPASAEMTRWVSAPGTARLGLRYQFSAANEVSLWPSLRWQGAGENRYLPGLGAGYHHTFATWKASLGANFGWDAARGFTGGLLASKTIKLGNSQLRISGGAGQVLGWLLPATGTGVSAWGGLAYRWRT